MNDHSVTSRKPEQKTAYIYETVLIGGPKYREQPFISWQNIHTKLAELDANDRLSAGVLYTALPSVPGHDIPVFSMHKEFEPEFMSKIDRKGGTIEDLKLSPDELFQWAHGTVVVPIGDKGLFALCKGTPSAPGRTAAENLLKGTVDHKENQTFQVDNVISTAKVEEFKEATRAKGFSASYSTERSLTSVELDPDNFVGFLQQISYDLGLSLKVSLNVELERSSNDRRGQEQMYRMAEQSVPITKDLVSDAEVVTVDEFGMERVLNLAAKNLSVKFDLPPPVAESKSFSELVTGLVRAVPRIVEQLPEGIKDST